MGWDPVCVDVQLLHCMDQFLHCSVTHRDSQRHNFLTFCYGLHTVEDRKSLWGGISRFGWFSFVRESKCLNVA